jgi:hypothetical protein
MLGTVTRLVVTMLAGAAFLFLSGCADSYSGYQSDSGRAHYDQYVERAGYYDFGRPVIFVPDSRVGLE